MVKTDSHFYQKRKNQKSQELEQEMTKEEQIMNLKTPSVKSYNTHTTQS